MEIIKKPNGKFEMISSSFEIDESEVLNKRSIVIKKIKTEEENLSNNKALLAKFNAVLGKKAEDITEEKGETNGKENI